MTTVPYFTHQGMTYVPLGFPPQLNDNSEVIGGSAWGAGTVAGGDGSRQPSIKELEVAHIQGQQFGNMIKAYVKGKQAIEAEEKK
jgi:multimeric flavodoxin WrbA